MMDGLNISLYCTLYIESITFVGLGCQQEKAKELWCISNHNTFIAHNKSKIGDGI